jgi:hypothetical protein
MPGLKEEAKLRPIVLLKERRAGLGHYGRNILFLPASPPLRIPSAVYLFYFDFDRFRKEDRSPETSASFLARDQRLT